MAHTHHAPRTNRSERTAVKHYRNRAERRIVHMTLAALLLGEDD
ncbi:MAG: hypothetical protein ACYDHD_00115 [Vulcanimicrobiaceae bacterium]